MVACCVTIAVLLVDICNIFRLTDEAGCTFHVNGYVMLQNYVEKCNVWRIKGYFIKKMGTVALLLGFEKCLCDFLLRLLSVGHYGDEQLYRVQPELVLWPNCRRHHMGTFSNRICLLCLL